MFRLTLILNLCLICGISFAQNPSESEPYIEVVGIATMEIVPDQIYIKIKIEEDPDQENLKSVSERETLMTEALKDIGIDLKNLRLKESNEQLSSGRWFSKSKNLAYREYELMVVDAEQLQQVFEIIKRLKINSAYVKRVSHSQIEKYQKQNRLDAIEAAKEKAKYLSAALDRKLGPSLIIRESELSPLPPVIKPSSVWGSILTDPDISVSTNPDYRSLALMSSIVVRFAME